MRKKTIIIAIVVLLLLLFIPKNDSNSESPTLEPEILNQSPLNNEDSLINSNDSIQTGYVYVYVNYPPVANNDTFNSIEDEALVIDYESLLLNDKDKNNDNIKIIDHLKAAHGTVVNDGESFIYKPSSNFNGEDRFTYAISDGEYIDTATVTIVVKAVNDSPIAKDDTYSLNEDNDLNVSIEDLLSNDSDIDDDNLSFVNYSASSHGTLVQIQDSTLTYTPNENYNGADSFTYTVSDGTESVTGTVNITINSLNDLPVANNDMYNVDEDNDLIISIEDLLSNDSDVDDDNLSFVNYSVSSHGTLVQNQDSTLTYTPDENYNGADSFTYTVSDGTESVTGTVNITINSLNDLPVANNDMYNVDEDNDLIISIEDLLNNDSDVDDDDLSFVNYFASSHGTLVQNQDSTLTYTPDENYNGADSFTYTISDGLAESSAQVNIQVAPVNDPPVANYDSYTMGSQYKTLYVLNNDYDPDGDTLTITSVSHVDMKVYRYDTYLKYKDTGYPYWWSSPDTFYYYISDGNGGTAQGKVKVTFW